MAKPLNQSQVNATDGRFDEAVDHFAKAMEAPSPRDVGQTSAAMLF